MTYATPDYLEQLKLYHKQKEYTWGTGSPIASKFPRILNLFDSYECNTILDYGCGSGSLKKYMRKEGHKMPIIEYDIGIAGKDSPPPKADLVVCMDVMEHVEEQYVGDVLGHIAKLADKVAYFEICSWEAKAVLPDGRNAHVTVKPHEWWEKELGKHFYNVDYNFKPPAHLFYAGVSAI